MQVQKHIVLGKILLRFQQGLSNCYDGWPAVAWQEPETNSIESRTEFTRAQQLLRWATFGHNRHGPKVGRGCCGGWVPI